MSANQWISFLIAGYAVFMDVLIFRALDRYRNCMTCAENKAFKFKFMTILLVASLQVYLGISDISVTLPIFKVISATYVLSGHYWLKTLERYKMDGKVPNRDMVGKER